MWQAKTPGSDARVWETAARCEEAEGEQRWRRPSSPRAGPSTASVVAPALSLPLSEAPGQANGPLSQRDGDVFPLLFVLSPRGGALGAALRRTVSRVVPVPWERGLHAFRPREAEFKGRLLGGSREHGVRRCKNPASRLV